MKNCWLFHTWGKWKTYAVGVVLRQRRVCLRCGYTQDVQIDWTSAQMPEKVGAEGE